VDDASLAGIGWLRADWFVEGEVENTELSESDEAAQVRLAHEHLAALLAGQEAAVQDTDAHSVHVAIEGSAVAGFGLTAAQRNAVAGHVKDMTSGCRRFPRPDFA